MPSSSAWRKRSRSAMQSWHGEVRRGHEERIPGPCATDPVLRPTELARVLAAATTARQEDAVDLAEQPVGQRETRRAVVRGRAQGPRRSWRPRRRRRAERLEPHRARTAADRRVTTGCLRSARTAPPPSARTCRGTAPCRAARSRPRPADRRRGSPPPTLVGDLHPTRSPAVVGGRQARTHGSARLPRWWSRSVPGPVDARLAAPCRYDRTLHSGARYVTSGVYFT